MNHLNEILNNIKLGLFNVSMFVLFVAALVRLVIGELKKLF